MTCNNPDGCDCANQSFCKWYSTPKKKAKTGLKSSGTLKRTPLKKKSVKQAENLEIYSQLRAVFLKKFPRCQIQTKKCTKMSTDVHHSGRRGKNLNNTGTWVSCCRTCHEYIERNTVWARENGWLL